MSGSRVPQLPPLLLLQRSAEFVRIFFFDFVGEDVFFEGRRCAAAGGFARERGREEVCLLLPGA